MIWDEEDCRSRVSVGIIKNVINQWCRSWLAIIQSARVKRRNEIKRSGASPTTTISRHHEVITHQQSDGVNVRLPLSEDEKEKKTFKEKLLRFVVAVKKKNCLKRKCYSVKILLGVKFHFISECLANLLLVLPSSVSLPLPLPISNATNNFVPTRGKLLPK